MTGRLSGPLLIGASSTIAEFMLPRVLGEFKSRYPDVHARLFVGNSGTVEGRVGEHSIDVGLIEAPSHLQSLATEPCCEDELQVVVSPTHPLAKLKSVTPKQLLAHSYISREEGSGTREFTDLYLRKAGIGEDELKAEMELGSPEALKGVVSAGAGFAILSGLAVEKERRLGDLVVVPLQPRLMRTLSLVYPKEKFRSRLVNTFVEFAKQKLRDPGH
jgi:DNA-binding transcriptional LysR family regulator